MDRVTQLVGAPPVALLPGVGALTDETIDLRRRAHGGCAARKETESSPKTLHFLDSGHQRVLSVGRLRVLQVFIERPGKVEQRAERLRGVEVVVHRRFESDPEAAGGAAWNGPPPERDD